MRKFILIAILSFSLLPLHALSLEIGDGSLLIKERNFSISLPSLDLYFKGKYFSYGRLDRFSAYSTLFNPYRKYHNIGLSVSDGNEKGLRGLRLSLSDFSISFSTGEAFTTALSYDGRYLDISLVYYDLLKRDEKDVIHNYRRKDKRDIYSLIIHTGYRSYLDFITVLSYSPHLGIDGFYRVRASYDSLFLTLSYGNMFLSGSDGLFSVESGIKTKHVDFDYSIRYDEGSYYTDFFRSYSSLYRLSLKYGLFSFSHTSDFSFSSSAEREHVERLAIGYDGLMVSYDSKGRLLFSLKRIPLEIGMRSTGAFIRCKMGRSVMLEVEGGAFRVKVELSF